MKNKISILVKFIAVYLVLFFITIIFLVSGCSPAPGEPSNVDAVEEQEEAGVDEVINTSDEDRVSEGGERDVLFEEVELAGRIFKLELALDDEQRALGLMWREHLADDEGMLFVFPDREPYPRELGFWMKNCLLPIDVLFIGRDGSVTAIHEMQPPEPGMPDEELPGYYSEGPAQFAIEIRGGLTAELGLTVGEKIELRYDYLVGLAD